MHYFTGDSLFNLSVSHVVNRCWHSAVLCASEALQVRAATLPPSHHQVVAAHKWVRDIKYRAVKSLLVSEGSLSTELDSILHAKLGYWL
jgi:hypothetical protein